MTEDEFWENLNDQKWRLNNLYYIQDPRGQRVLFKMNKAQEEFFDSLHYKNIILKARQLGFSTFIQLFMLDMAVFYGDTACGVIAQTLRDATALFRTKVLYAYENLPDFIKQDVSIVTKNKSELILSNGSSILVGTSLRSGTYQFLHISEFGKIAARSPDRAEEIISGALNTQEPSGWAFIESTAEGKGGRFYEFVAKSRELKTKGVDLGEEGREMDWKFHFFPWFEDPKYKLKLKSAEIDHKYFDTLEAELGLTFTPEQKAWWSKKNEDMKDKMSREFPSTPDEAFAAPLVGAYYGEIMARLEKEGKITNVPYDPKYPVETWWDIGHHDHTSIWFVQILPTQINVIDFYQNRELTLPHYAKVLKEKPYNYSRHVGPHDSANTDWSDSNGLGRNEVAEAAGLRPWIVAARLSDVTQGIDAVKDMLPKCYFDKTNCEVGLTALRSYKRKWDDKLGIFTNKPLHDKYSDAADAFRTGATAPKDYGDTGFDKEIKVPSFGAI